VQNEWYEVTEELFIFESCFWDQWEIQYLQR